MKKLLLFMCLVMTMVFVNQRFAFAVEPPGVLDDSVMNIQTSEIPAITAEVPTVETAEPIPIGDYSTIAAFLILVTFVTEWLKKLISTNSFVVQMTSWIVGLIMAIIGYFTHVGIFADISIWLALLYGFVGSLVANGVFDTGMVTWFLSLFRRQQRT